MSSIINSISVGELQVQQVPEVKPLKEDSIIDLLQKSEIEFETCPKLEKTPEPEILYEIEELHKEIKEKPPIELLDPEHLLMNPNIQFENDTTDDFNTGFGSNNDLHYKDPCVKPPLKTPLYQENYLHEFETEEEKAQARRALGLYNKDDVVAMSLLTAEDTNPTKLNWSEIPVKELRKGDKPFVPITSFSAIFDSSGVSLTTRFKDLQTTIKEHQKAITDITKISNSKQITSLGDVKLFLEGFNNGDNLKERLDTINQDMLRFEKSG